MQTNVPAILCNVRFIMRTLGFRTLCLAMSASTLATAFAILMSALVLVGCTPKRPGLDLSRSIASFSHNGLENVACVKCHAKDRPLPVGGIEHGGGADCVQCHVAGTTWKNGGGATSHNPVPQSCANCHENKRALGPGPSPHGKGLDCVYCHNDRAGSTWQVDVVAKHTPIPGSCASCHDPIKDRPASWYYPSKFAARLNPQPGHFGTSDCKSCHESPNNPAVTVFRFQHTNSQGVNFSKLTIASGGTCLPCHEETRPTLAQDPIHPQTGDCIGCHAAAALGSGSPFEADWKASGLDVGGMDHAVLDPATVCAECHDTGKPRAARPLVSYAPADYSSKTSPVSDGHYMITAKDCASCHHIPDPAITPAWKFNHKTFKQNAATGDTTVNTCLPCHKNQWPSAASAPMHPTPAPAPATNDCVSCHQGSLKVLPLNWKTSVWVEHAATPAAGSCNQCHQTGTGGTVARPANHYGTTDCFSCHQSPGRGVVSFLFTHSNAAGAWYKDMSSGATCLPCHTADRPSTTVNPTHPTTGDCAGCHVAGAPTITQAGSWQTATFTHNPLPNSCNMCHDDAKSYDARPAVSYLPLNYPTKTSPQAGHYGANDCVSCHRSPLTTGVTVWSFNHTNASNVNFKDLPSGKTCLPCHASETAIPGISITGAAVAHGKGADCALCHTGTVTKTWATRSAYTHPSRSQTTFTCSDCHAPSEAKAPITSWSTMAHAENRDCTQCHVSPANPVTGLVGWDFDKKTHLTSFYNTKRNNYSISTCLPCHERKRPSNHHVGQDCAGCHTRSGW